jgi:cytochrome c peroxidase
MQRLAETALAGGLVLAVVIGPFPLARGQTVSTGSPSAARAGEIAHLQKMARLFPNPGNGVTRAPRMIPQLKRDPDPSGLIATYQPGGPAVTKNVPFFQNLGTNGRTCFTCHQPADGWTISARDVQARFAASAGQDPLFRPVDGATCPSADVSSLAARRKAYGLLLAKGLIRIGLPMPANPEFSIINVDDPYGCNTDPATGLTGMTSGVVSVYRRPLPATNLGFLSTFMWDGREPSLESQAVDATLGHAEGNQPPTPAQQQQIVAFESGLFTAQLFDADAKYLSAEGAAGGPVALANALASFYLGINDPFGGNPTGAPFTSNVFALYDNWGSFPGNGSESAARQAIARGQEIFNRTPVMITGVTGINDVLGVPVFSGSCGTCHDTPNVGDHSMKAPLNIGVSDAGANSPPGLDISGLPVFTLSCISGPLAGQVFRVTDLGRAMITGKCADIGKLKGPILRGLVARAPYFHNGSAASLMDVVNFYDQRFGIGFTDRQKSDLVAFLNAL